MPYAGPIEPAQPATHTLDYVGPTGTLFGIFYKNLFLTILTLGIYRFWAKTRTRCFLWSNTRIDGEGFEYTGTGKELFLGFLKALLILVPLFFGLQLVALLLGDGAEQAIGAIQGLLTLVLVYFGTFAARRYRMSRTTWRGIRMQQDGSPWRYAAIALKGLFLSIVTLGLYYPFMQTALMRYELGNLRFGSAPFRFTGEGKGLFKIFIKFWIAIVVLIAAPFLIALSESAFAATNYGMGLFSIWDVFFLMLLIAIFGGSYWYRAKVYRFQAGNAFIENLGFSMPELTGWRLFRLTAGNYLILIFSLMLLTPLTIQRTTRFWVRHTQLAGSVDLARVAQAARGPGTGEGVAGFFDIDLG